MTPPTCCAGDRTELGSADDIAAGAVLAHRPPHEQHHRRPHHRHHPGARRVLHRPPARRPHRRIGDALRQVAAICDRRVTALADLAAEHQPAWARTLGAVPQDQAGRDQWLARAEIVVTYRDRYQLTNDHPIGAEPPTGDISRWDAWHRARVALGAATLAGHLTTTDNAELAKLITAQQTIDATAPTYVADQLRSAHLDLTDAEHRHHDLTLLLAAITTAGQRAATQAQQQQPRWWQRGPSRARMLAAQQEAHQRAAAAASHHTSLSAKLATLSAGIDQRRERVTLLETHHADWQRWYTNALPTRYAGLAAAAEQTRRAATRRANLADAVAATTARVRAIDDTRPQPHAAPVTEHLTHQADAARRRTSLTPDQTVAEGTELD